MDDAQASSPASRKTINLSLVLLNDRSSALSRAPASFVDTDLVCICDPDTSYGVEVFGWGRTPIDASCSQPASNSLIGSRPRIKFDQDTEYAFLLDGVSLDGLACKDGVRGWWCEGELTGESLIPLLADDRGRAVASLLPARNGSGALIATAAGRLPIFSRDASLAPNVFFSNLLAFCRHEKRTRVGRRSHTFVHSGNWSHRSFLASADFGAAFTGIHWNCLDQAILAGTASIWIPWESNTRALTELWPLLERAVSQGATLVIEDLRDGWCPEVKWHSRPVDSSWWREKRLLDLVFEPAATRVFPSLPEKSFVWHYHGVFDGPPNSVPLLKTADGKNVLSFCGPTANRRGRILVSTLDATFEYGVGKIRETASYIRAVLDLATDPERDCQ